MPARVQAREAAVSIKSGAESRFRLGACAAPLGVGVVLGVADEPCGRARVRSAAGEKQVVQGASGGLRGDLGERAAFLRGALLNEKTALLRARCTETATPAPPAL